MANQADRQLQEAYRAWLAPRRPERAVAVTMTFRPGAAGAGISAHAARDAVRHFSNQLNQKAFGRAFKRKERRLSFIPVMEGGDKPGEKHRHYHIQVEVPDDWALQDWIDMARRQLRKIRCVGADQCVIRPVVDAGWESYMLKLRDKRSFDDAVDVMNMWVN